MTNANTIRKAVQAISVAALMTIASGCATQANGGSKLDYDELQAQVVQNQDVVRICHQYGATSECHLEDRDTAEEDIRDMIETFRYSQDY